MSHLARRGCPVTARKPTPEGEAQALIVELPAMPLYGVTDTGQVWSKIKPGRSRGVSSDWHALRQTMTGKGYLSVTICVEGSHRRLYVHRLVWEAFRGPILDRLEVNHIDGNKQNNQLSNLELVTSSANKIHAYLTGLRLPRRGSNNPRAKLDEESVVELRRRAGAGESVRSLAHVFGLSHQAARSAVRGSTWKHVSGGL